MVRFQKTCRACIDAFRSTLPVFCTWANNHVAWLTDFDALLLIFFFPVCFHTSNCFARQQRVNYRTHSFPLSPIQRVQAVTRDRTGASWRLVVATTRDHKAVKTLEIFAFDWPVRETIILTDVPNLLYLFFMLLLFLSSIFPSFTSPSPSPRAR